MNEQRNTIDDATNEEWEEAMRSHAATSARPTFERREPKLVAAAATGSVCLSDDDLLKILRNGKPNSKEFMAMTYDSWKDGIDVTEPTAFLRRLLTAARDYTPNKSGQTTPIKP